MKTRRKALVALALLAAATVGCGQDLFGPPRRVKTHGYRATVTIQDGKPERKTEVAVRDQNRRQEPVEGASGPILIWRGAEKKSYELDAATKSYKERPFTTLDEILPGYPLAPGFNQKAEADRRKVTKYSREGDDVFAGHVCWIWRFDDVPDKEGTPSTAYWVAADLDFVVMRLIRDIPSPDGKDQRQITQLTNVRVGADEDLFQIPQGWTKK